MVGPEPSGASQPLFAGGYRMPAPSPESAIVWPDDFGTRFSLFVDTEEEFDWDGPFRREARATTAIAALPEAHRRFADRGVPIAYMVDHPVATDPAAIDAIRGILADDPATTVGTQLHPWVNPPFDEDVCVHNSFAGNLPRELERAKLVALTDAIEAAFDLRPILYRAGRYGLGPNSLGLLEELGYRIDSSMRSSYDYSDQGGPDYSAIPNHAFRTGPTGALVELPLTAMFTGALRGVGKGLHDMLESVPRGQGAFSRLGLLSRVVLTPEDMPLDAALEAVRVAVGEGLPLLNFSYHSPTIVPGHTPYVRDAADLAEFWRWWDEMFDLLDQLGVRPASVDQLLRATQAS